MTDLDSNPRTEQLANPFRPGNGVAPPYLAGRDALLAEFERYLGETHPPHANWTLTGIRGTGKTVLLGEFATRGERAGWLCLGRELSDRHRDDARLADAIADDCAALVRRCSSLAGLGDAIERAWQYVRPRRVSVGELGYEPAYETESRDAAEVIGAALLALDGALAQTDVPGVLFLYDEAHLLGDDRRAERYPLSSLLAGFGQAQRTSSRVRLVLCGLPTLSLNLKRARTYAERMFRHVVIGHLERGDAWDALAIPLSGSGRSFELPLIGEIVERTGGYPYFLQFFGGFLCSRVGRADVALTDYLGPRVEPAPRARPRLLRGPLSRRRRGRPAGARRHGPRRRAPLGPEPAPLSGRPPQRRRRRRGGSSTAASSTGRRAAPMTSPCPSSARTCAGGPN